MNVKLEYASFQDFANRLWPCLSEEGMWVPSDRSAGVGELVDFDVMLADGFRLFHGTGQVIGVGPGPEGAPAGAGMTIRFSQLDGPSQNLVRKVVSKHRGEGGRPFVLSAPATKVEVVGDEESDDSRSIGPEDLVAPFPDLEAETDWADGAEPELTSFLRPSGGSTDLELEADSGGLPNLDFRAEAPILPEPPAAEDAVVPQPEPPDLEAPGSEAPDSETPDLAAAAWTEDPMSEDEQEALVPEPPVTDEDDEASLESVSAKPPPTLTLDELAESTFDELHDDHEGGGAATQAVVPMFPEDPLLSDDGAAGAAASFAPPDVERMPSTVVPPSVENFEAADFDDDELMEVAPAGTNLAKWLWALVALVAIVAGFFYLQRFFDRDSEPVSSAAPSAGGEVSVVTGTGDSTAGATDDMASSSDDASGVDVTDGSAGDDLALDAVGDGSASTGSAADSSVADNTAAVDPGAETDALATRAPTGASSDEPAPVAADAAARPAADDLLRLQRITWSERDGDTVIRLWLDGAAPDDRLSTLRVTEGAPRLLLKIAGIAGAIPRTPTTIGSAHVERLRFGVHPTSAGAELHIVADLTDDAVDMIGALAVDESGVELRVGRSGG